MVVELATTVSEELLLLWRRGVRDVELKRGGAELVRTLCAGATAPAWLERVVASRSLWQARGDGELRGYGFIDSDVIAGIYVASAHRRQKIATEIVRVMLSSSPPPLDAYALPGDRATKSLYESIGWKARLLTMRGAPTCDEPPSSS